MYICTLYMFVCVYMYVCIACVYVHVCVSHSPPELREEIEMLRAFLGQGVDPSASLAEVRELREKLQESEKLMKDATQ